jgi:hypothetical protein
LNLKKLPFFHICAVTFSICIASYVHANEGDNNLYLTPRLGPSFSTGMLGVEAQYGNYALAAGVIPVCFYSCSPISTVAFNYYFNNGIGTSWSVGIFSWRWSDNNATDNIIGLGAQYRMQLYLRSNITFGVGIGKQQSFNTGVELMSSILPSISYGYSF